MAIGKRIRFFRNRKGMTQKQLGEILGFLGKTSDVRMAQYETEARTPKHDLVKEMANIFDVSTHALTVPDIDTYIGLMHTLFALEDMYGLKIGEIDGEICLRLDKSDYSTYSSMNKMLRAWLAEAKKPSNWNRAKLPKRNTTSGGISTRNWITRIIGRKFPHRRSVICLWNNFRKSRKKKRKQLKSKSRNKHKKTLPIFSCHSKSHLKISKVFLLF